jgi:hypothetical protein
MLSPTSLESGWSFRIKESTPHTVGWVGQLNRQRVYGVYAFVYRCSLLLFLL